MSEYQIKSSPKAGWEEFEEIVESLYRQFSPDAQVERDASILGKSGQPRQIDVLIRGKIGPHHVCGVIDCKDYGRPVTIARIDELVGKLDDVQAHFGVIVSNAGFAEGARDRADALKGRVYICSVIDAKNERLRRHIRVPLLRDVRIAKSIRVIPATGRLLRRHRGLRTRVFNTFVEWWNNEAGLPDPGKYSYRGTVTTDEEGETEVRIEYEVQQVFSTRSFHLTEGRGIFNHLTGHFTGPSTYAVTLMPDDLVKGWKRVDPSRVHGTFLTFKGCKRLQAKQIELRSIQEPVSCLPSTAAIRTSDDSLPTWATQWWGAHSG